MHREVMKDELAGTLQVDHRNRNGLDNRRENLRVVTPAGNRQNLRPRKKCRSKYRNVHWESDRQKWRAIVAVGPKGQQQRYYSRRFNTEEEADVAAKQLRAKHFPLATD